MGNNHLGDKREEEAEVRVFLVWWKHRFHQLYRSASRCACCVLV